MTMTMAEIRRDRTERNEKWREAIRRQIWREVTTTSYYHGNRKSAVRGIENRSVPFGTTPINEHAFYYSTRPRWIYHHDVQHHHRYEIIEVLTTMTITKKDQILMTNVCTQIIWIDQSLQTQDVHI